MKILNKPIKVMAIFYTDGKIEPVKFRIEDKVVRIGRVVKAYEEHIVGNVRIVFVCIQNEKYTYELKYELESSIWYLFKK
jgi:starvation-inducible outer membrane lipoprotein